MDELIISVSGLRGIVGPLLTPVVAAEYVASFLTQLLHRGPVVVTRDGRQSGSMLACAVGSAAMAMGFDWIDADVAATPTTGVLVRTQQAVAGIQISASHNPIPYNGIKLFGPDGRVITAKLGQKVSETYRAKSFRWQTTENLGKRIIQQETVSEHLKWVLATVDVPAIQRRQFKILLDSNHGAGSLLGRSLLKALGCQFEIVGDTPDGRFAHPPEPTRQNLGTMMELAKQRSADAVFCQDPDADRLAIIDAQGDYIGEEYTVALCLRNRLESARGAVVTNCSTSRMAADIAQQNGSHLVLSAVGEANVTDAMIEHHAVYGGEGNGGPIDPRVGYVRDSFVGMAQVLDLMARSGKTIQQLVSELPRYEIHKTTIEIDRTKIPELFDAIGQHFTDATLSKQDGLRLDWNDAWLLVRASNTEPIVRAVAESKSLSRSQALCQTVADLART